MAPFSSHLEFQLLASPFNDSSTPIPRSARSESSHSHSSPSNTNTNTPFNTPSNTTSHTASGRTHTGMHVDSHLRLRESHAAMVARKLLRQRAVQARDEDVIYETAMPPLLLPVVPMRGGSGSSKSGSTKSGNVDAGDVEAGEAVDYENAPSTSNSNSSLHSTPERVCGALSVGARAVPVPAERRVCGGLERELCAAFWDRVRWRGGRILDFLWFCGSLALWLFYPASLSLSVSL